MPIFNLKFNMTLAHVAKLIEDNYDYFSAGLGTENIKMVISEIHPAIFDNRYIVDTHVLVNTSKLEDVEVNLMKFMNSDWNCSRGGVNHTVVSAVVTGLGWAIASQTPPLA